MKIVINTYMIFGITLVCAVSGRGQQPVPLTVEQCVQIGLEKSKSLHSSLMKVHAANARASETNAARLPLLKFGGSYTRLSDVPGFEATIPAGTFGAGFPPQTVSFPLSQTILDNYNFRLTLQQPLFTGFRLQSSSEIAEKTAQAAHEEFNKDGAELVYNIKTVYWNLFKAREFNKVLDENVEQVKAHLRDVKHLMGQGMLTSNEVLRVEVQLSNAQLLQIDARNSVRLAVISLNNVIGQNLATQVDVVSEPDSLTVSEAGQQEARLGEMVMHAIDTRPEMKAMQLRVEAAAAGVTLAKSGWFPQIYLNGNYYYARPNQRIVPAQDRFKDTWDVSLAASFDIWNWGATSHETRQAEAQLEQAKDGIGQLRDAITLEVTQSFLNVDQARERIGVSEQAAKQASENYRITNEKFKLGLVLNSDMLDAEVALLQAKTNHTQALVDHAIALAKLQRSTGQ